MSTESVRIEVQAVTVAIGARTVCRELSLTPQPGELWAVLGCNGSGKTTLLHTLAGLRNPAAGRVLLAGHDLHTLSRRRAARYIGLQPQEEGAAFPATVLETALMGRHPHLGRWRGEGPEDLEQTQAALHTVGLEGFEGRSVATLSGGERRRLALATVLTQDPAILLLDEPTDRLDIQYAAAVLAHLGTLAAAGRTLLVVLHDPNLALRYCNHALLLFGDGETAQGSVTDLLTPEQLGRLYRHPLARVEGPDGPVLVPRASGR